MLTKIRTKCEKTMRSVLGHAISLPFARYVTSNEVPVHADELSFNVRTFKSFERFQNKYLRKDCFKICFNIRTLKR